MSSESAPVLVIENLGCKVNRYEADSIAQQFAAAGYRISENIEEADVYVLNTCGVTAAFKTGRAPEPFRADCGGGLSGGAHAGCPAL